MLTGHREDLLSSMLPVYRELLKHKLNILVYSGDVDAIVPVKPKQSCPVLNQYPLAHCGRATLWGHPCIQGM